MTDLMRAIRSRLTSELDYVKSGNVFIAPDEGYIPDNLGTPGIGIADGGFERTDGFAGSYDKKLWVVVLPTVMLRNSIEAGIMGTVNDKGVLDIAWDIEQALHNHIFPDDVNLPGLQGASIVKQSPSFPIKISDALSWQRVVMTFEYQYRVCG